MALTVVADADCAALLASILGAADANRLAMGEQAGTIAPVARRLEQRGAEISALLGHEALTRERERGRRASSDEALRWAIAALESSAHTVDQSADDRSTAGGSASPPPPPG